MRVSDADRNLVIDLLGAAYAEGRITRDEHDQRLSQAMAARTFNDLVPLTVDLADVPFPTGLNHTAIEPAASGVDTVFAVFSSTERRGNWQVREHTSVMSIFGGVKLDLTQAVFTCAVVEFNVIAMFGGVEIKVPAGVRVRNEVLGVFGGTDSKRIGPPIDGAPTIVVKGMALFGGVEVKGPR